MADGANTVSAVGVQQSVTTPVRREEREYTVSDLKSINFLCENDTERIKILESVLEKAKALRNPNSKKGVYYSGTIKESDFKLSNEEIRRYEKELRNLRQRQNNPLENTKNSLEDTQSSHEDIKSNNDLFGVNINNNKSNNGIQDIKEILSKYGNKIDNETLNKMTSEEKEIMRDFINNSVNSLLKSNGTSSNIFGTSSNIFGTLGSYGTGIDA